MSVAPLFASFVILQASLGGLSFGEALSRAERYETDPKAQAWRKEKLMPLLNGRMQPVFEKCDPGAKAQRFTLVVSYKAGRFDRIEANDDGPAARCIVESMQGFPWPAPPYDDFAEEFRMNLNGK